MIVIYTADVEKGATCNRMDIDSLTFTITEAFLSELDKDLVWKAVTEKVSNNIDISSEEIIRIR